MSLESRETAHALDEAEGRVRAMPRIYQTLCQSLNHTEVSIDRPDGTTFTFRFPDPFA